MGSGSDGVLELSVRINECQYTINNWDTPRLWELTWGWSTTRFYLPVPDRVTHWDRGKIAAISQTTFSNVFSWMKMYEFRFRFLKNMFLRFELTTFPHWFRWWFGANQLTSHYLNQWWLVYWRTHASFGFNYWTLVIQMPGCPKG